MSAFFASSSSSAHPQMETAGWLSPHGTFGGTWLSDYVANKLGGFLDGGPVQKTEEHKQSERRLDTPVQENEELGLGDILMR